MTRLDPSNSHGDFPVSALENLTGDSSHWYEILPVRNHPIQDAVFFNLYLENQQVSVDSNMGKISEARAQGKDRLPVVFHYYPAGVLPVGSIDNDNVALEIMDMFNDDNFKISPPPNWKSGDYTTMMSTIDLWENFDIPEKEEIDEDLWDAIEQDLRSNGFTFPAIIVMAAGEGDIDLYNSAERISVARELEIAAVPVVFFYEPGYENSVNAYCYRLVRGERELAAFAPFGTPGNLGGAASAGFFPTPRTTN